MLRADNNAQVVRLPFRFAGLLSGRYAIASGTRVFELRWRRGSIEAVYARQLSEPVAMVRDGRRVLWYFHDRFYWEDEDLTAADVAALVFQREERRQRRLESAHSLMRAHQPGGRAQRAPIPVELRRAVYERDGGACCQCGATFDLQYDHVLPVALGGASTYENLQLLCSECNRSKGDSL